MVTMLFLILNMAMHGSRIKAQQQTLAWQIKSTPPGFCSDKLTLTANQYPSPKPILTCALVHLPFLCFKHIYCYNLNIFLL